MPRKKKTDATVAPIFDVKLTTAPCVPAIRDKVDAWRAGDYQGASDATRQLLNFRLPLLAATRRRDADLPL